MPKTDNWLPKLKKIDDVLVEGDLYFKQWNGSTAAVHVIVGRPKPTLDGKDYYCPIQAKGCFKGVKLVVGADPAHSLMIAMRMLGDYSDYLHGKIDFLPELYERPTLRRWRFKRLPDC